MMMGSMKSAWESHPHKRPGIDQIRNLLYDCFSDQEFALVGQNVADIVRLYGVQPAKRSAYDWKPLNALQDSGIMPISIDKYLIQLKQYIGYFTLILSHFAHM